MDFEHSAKVLAFREKLETFMVAHIYPAEEALMRGSTSQPAWTSPSSWTSIELTEDLKDKAKAAGLWNLFLPDAEHGAGLTNLEYAPLCEIMGRSPFAPEIFNCSAPDTGNMELLARFGTPEQKSTWLDPLLRGEIRSCFAMTEPAVASSDATNVEARIERDGDDYVINGLKWFTSGIGDPRCKVIIFMGKSDPGHADVYRQQSMILVPRDAAGVRVTRMLDVFGFTEAPHGHGEVTFENVRVPAANMILGEGKGFEIAQARLGPGRIHHCMRQIGAAERALELMCQRVTQRVAFGKPIAEQSVTLERIAEARVAIDQARFLTLHAAWKMDRSGNKEARKEIAMIKVVAPSMACRVIDMAIQAFGGAGVTQDVPLSQLYAWARSLRIADGPDEVHRNQIGRQELKRSGAAAASHGRTNG
ncbi:acyl-CoA dehydrogenase family protein [Aminobacter sp. LjRoot7]|uniref:acyl-CoA dehydrogenase family protein n=1 Tax=Aminobacter sp. LjRoot7 TaxID=3342335 RepID=UPI003ECEFC8E